MPISRPTLLPRPIVSFCAALALLAPGLARAQALPGDHSPAPAATAPVFEQWTLLVLNHHPSGFGSVTTTQDAGTKDYRTESNTVFVVKREGVRLRVSDSSTIVEDADGAVLNFIQTLSEGGAKVEIRGVRDGDDLVVTSHGKTERFHVPRLAALGPEAIERATDAVPLKPGQTFSLDTFSPDDPQAPVIQSGTVVDQEDHDVRGKTMKLWKISVTSNVMPGVPSVGWVDSQSNQVESVETFPSIGEMHEYTTDRAECMKQPEGAEVFATSLISPDQALPHPDALYQVTYKILSTDLNAKMTFCNEGDQRVISSEPGTIVVEVTARTFRDTDAGYGLPAADTSTTHSYLQASAYLESDNPDIKKLAREAVGTEKNPVEAARKIEHFVSDYIVKKDLNVAFGSAEDTAKSREGDCTEHAVLCAAIGRAAGLPTRCVVGLGYIPPGESVPTIAHAVDHQTGIFGFHMWAEAMIAPDLWMPMDAALGSFDVGHIAIFKTPLDGINPMTDSESVLTLMDNLHIQVIKTVTKEEARGEAVRQAAVAERAAAQNRAKAASAPAAPSSSPGASPAPATVSPKAAPAPPVYHAPSSGKKSHPVPEGFD